MNKELITQGGIDMNKEQIKRATFQDLIAKKLKRDKERIQFKEIEVSSMGMSIQFKKLEEEKVLDIADEFEKTEGLAEQIAITRKLIYLSCPMLQDEKLHEELGIKDPFDTVKVLFDLKDTNEIGEQLMALLGLSNADKEIKN
ncbi:hypothetical protein [Clostridium botulinum]|uniref:hypothetical protein n=1 Tax=Clostridium botulinum TaxID=1491 RepID=UPI001400CDB2|nr:hypothetical protein [Clostridium botulinum]MBY6915486.1 hypothetical protein [Clostridium botulinum]NFQ38296.1 hypothetical protein [Clostridium botulinum]